MRKVICSECEELIQGTEDPPEFKLCVKCILATTPAADINKLVDSTGHRYDAPKEPVRKKRETELSIYTEIITQQLPADPKPLVLLLIKAEDYLTKKVVLQFGTSLETVKEWYEQMKEIDENPVPPPDESE